LAFTIIGKSRKNQCFEFLWYYAVKIYILRGEITLSKFYTEIAKYYDYIFPTGKAQLGLIKELAGEPPMKILDIACGSGGYSKQLSDLGYEITAVDLDPSMIRRLKEKDEKLDARVLNMLDLDILNDTYDLLFCIGNSLVHLNNNEEILEFFRKCRQRLKPGRNLLIQIVNYDRILAKDITSLPLITNEEVGLTFERYYEYLPERHKICFKTVLKVDGLSLENSVLLHPLKSVELIELLRQAGFITIETYGSFEKNVFDPLNSFSLIVVAQR